MSLLMFKVDPHAGALILTDTLVTDTSSEPCQYTTKCRLLPHMNMAMAGTGSGNLLNLWAHRLSEKMMAVDIDMCASHAQAPLVELWDQICTEHAVGPVRGPNDPLQSAGDVAGRTATIYQFGQDESGRFVWYVLRSSDGFVPERWDEGGFATKPHPARGFGPSDVAPESIDEMIDLARRIRLEQDARPSDDRIHIGGELWLTSVQEGAFGQARVYRFDDWRAHWNLMNAHARRG